MKPHKQYDIAFVGLKSGEHEFDYDIDDSFFAEYGTPDFSDSHLHIRLLFEKQNRFFLLKFEITGQVTVNCDRCGDPFTMPVWDEFKLVVKLVEDPEAIQEEDPDVIYISSNESLLNVADWIYEFASLSVPMQRVHPDKDQGVSGCNQKALDMLKGMQEKGKTTNNPIWKDLEKFKNN